MTEATREVRPGACPVCDRPIDQVQVGYGLMWETNYDIAVGEYVGPGHGITEAGAAIPPGARIAGYFHPGDVYTFGPCGCTMQGEPTSIVIDGNGVATYTFALDPHEYGQRGGSREIRSGDLL